MHAHLPKPMHGWREFIGEVGIIVIGVLIALSAEQLAEAIHWRHKVEAVEEAIRQELVEDDLPQAYARVVIGHCLAQQLDGLRALAKPGSDGAAFLQAAARYVPPARTWDTDGQRLADQSDLAAHLSTEELGSIEQPYRYVSLIAPLAQDELSVRAALQRSRYGTGLLTAQDSGEINDAIDTLQFRNRQIAGAAWALLKVSRNAPGGGLPEPTGRRVLAEAREIYGACAAEFVPPNGGGNRQIYKTTGQNIFQGI